MELHKADLKNAGLQVVNIGLGEAKHAERYCGKLAPSLPCYAATSNDPYTAWGLRRATTMEFLSQSLNVMSKTLKAARAGHQQTETTGDAQMMPGTFIVDRQGVFRYAYYSAYAGDDPEIDVLVAAAQSLK